MRCGTRSRGVRSAGGVGTYRVYDSDLCFNARQSENSLFACCGRLGLGENIERRRKWNRTWDTTGTVLNLASKFGHRYMHSPPLHARNDAMS